MCIRDRGCDYTSGIWKVGVITAMKIVKQYSEMDDILTQIKQTEKFRLSKTFRKEVEFANYAFQYQRVFCPVANRITTLNNIPGPLINSHAEKIKIMGCIGSVVEKGSGIRKGVIDTKNIDHKVHEMIAKGELNPMDMTSILLNREKKIRTRNLYKLDLPVGEFDSLNNKAKQLPVDAHHIMFKRDGSFGNKSASSFFLNSSTTVTDVVPYIV